MSYDIYPPTSPPFDTGHLALDQTHLMYFEQSGNPDGQAVVLLHGGPGAGIDRWQQRFFDPRHYRIISYDQRGCGESAPAGELKNNTTSHLINDIESLRQHLQIERWLVIGGSWGSTLALAYAQQNPQRVVGLILRGVFLGQQKETSWLLDGVRHVFPEPWRQFIEFLPADEQYYPLDAYHHRVISPDPAIHLPAARAWCLFEASCSTLLPNVQPPTMTNDHNSLVLARIQTHYFKANFFVTEAEILDKIYKIRTIPTVIIHGRYDMICPIYSADQLHRAWPEAQYNIIANAGHAAQEPGIRRALVAATERFKTQQYIRRIPSTTETEGVIS